MSDASTIVCVEIDPTRRGDWLLEIRFANGVSKASVHPTLAGAINEAVKVEQKCRTA
jgi:hypothetical protein